jgi:hypothetical protein
MSDEERAQVLVTARLLASAEKAQWLSVALTVAAAVTRHPESAVLGLIAQYFSLRIALDARLFDDIASDRLTTSTFDSAAAAFQWRTGASPVPLTNRCRGAHRLIVIFALLLIAQTITLCVRSFF